METVTVMSRIKKDCRRKWKVLTLLIGEFYEVVEGGKLKRTHSAMQGAAG